MNYEKLKELKFKRNKINKKIQAITEKKERNDKDILFLKNEISKNNESIKNVNDIKKEISQNTIQYITDKFLNAKELKTLSKILFCLIIIEFIFLFICFFQISLAITFGLLTSMIFFKLDKELNNIEKRIQLKKLYKTTNTKEIKKMLLNKRTKNKILLEEKQKEQEKNIKIMEKLIKMNKTYNDKIKEINQISFNIAKKELEKIEYPETSEFIKHKTRKKVNKKRK